MTFRLQRLAGQVRLLVLIALGVGAAGLHAAVAQTIPLAPTNVIRVADLLTISVTGQSDLTGNYVVADDGSISMSLLGVVPAASLTTEAFSQVLRRRLDAYIKSPDVRVGVSRPAQVFVLGEVETPGSFPLTSGLTVVELLARVGQKSGGEVIVVRTPGARGPVTPDLAAPSSVKRVNLRALENDAEKGDLSRNLLLEPNDTIFVPKVDPTVAYVLGRVRNPGPYSILDGTTVLQLVTLAGGATDDASLNRIRIAHLNDGRGGTHRGGLSDKVRPGDSIMVPEAFQIPSVISVAPADPDAERPKPFRIPLGSYVAVSPSIAIWRIGVDSNVLNSPDHPEASLATLFGPDLGLTARLGRLTVDASAHLGLSVYPGHSSENAADPGYSVKPSIRVARWLTLRSDWSLNFTRERWSSEVDLRAHRREETQAAGFTFQPLSRLELGAEARDQRIQFDANQITYGADLQQTLSERVRSAKASARVRLTSLAFLTLSGATATHRFPLLPSRDADASEAAIGLEFRPTAAIEGRIQVGWLQYLPLDRSVEPFKGPTGRFDLSRPFFKRVLLSGRAERSIGTSFQPQFPFSIIEHAGGSTQVVLNRRIDVVGQIYLERYLNRQFVNPLPTLGPAWGDGLVRTYASQFGVRFGQTRVAATGEYVERLQPAGYHTVRLWVDISYGVFQVRSR